MRLEKVNASPIFRTECCKCHKRLYSDREPIFADLDGEAFKAYYCESCKDKLQKGAAMGRALP